MQLSRLQSTLLDLDKVPLEPAQRVASAYLMVPDLFEEPLPLLGCEFEPRLYPCG